MNTTSLEVTWTANDPSGIIYYEVGLDGNWTRLYNVSIGVNTFDITGPNLTDPNPTGLSEGYHNLTIAAYGGDGNNTNLTCKFFVDVIIPTLTISSPANGIYTNDPNVQLNWNCTDKNDSIAYYDLWCNGVLLKNMSTPDYTFPSLKDGEYNVTVIAVNNAGLVAEQNVTFTVDTKAPIIEAFTPAGSGVNPRENITITFL